MGKELKKHNTMPEFKKNRNPILMKGTKGSPIHANYGSPMEMDPKFKHKKKTTFKVEEKKTRQSSE